MSRIRAAAPPPGDRSPVRAGAVPPPVRQSALGGFVRRAAAEGRLVVQPRMGMSDPGAMRAGLLATRRARARTVGTVTLDSYTRLGDHDAVRQALADGDPLNGYPLVGHPREVTRGVLDGIQDDDFPVQVRHGSASPGEIFAAAMAAGLFASEGGPVSYCLPYGRTPLATAVRDWSHACELFTRSRELGHEPHLESFGGCMLGQLCPPSQLVAISALEGLFFYRHGLRSISVSYAQQTHFGQDVEAVLALRRLCRELMPQADCHVVVYTYMGVYPTTPRGCAAVQAEAARLASVTGAERLIVKTVAEASRIPTIEENVAALEHAASVAARCRAALPAPDAGPAVAGGGPGGGPGDATGVGPGVGAWVDGADSQTYAEAAALVAAVLDGGEDVGAALLRAFDEGWLDIPYCLHPDNRGRTRSYLDDQGRLRWADLGGLPLRGIAEPAGRDPVTSAGLLQALHYTSRRFDES